MHFQRKKIKINTVRTSKAPTQKMTLPFFYSFIGMQKVYEAAKYLAYSKEQRYRFLLHFDELTPFFERGIILIKYTKTRWETAKSH